MPKLMGKAMTPVAPLANAVLGNRLARGVMAKVVGVDAAAPIPTAQRQTLRGWLKRRPAPTTAPTRGPVVFFHGCAGGYFEMGRLGGRWRGDPGCASGQRQAGSGQ